MAEKRTKAVEPAAGAIPDRPQSGASVSRDALLPPPKEKLGVGFLIALLVHGALVVAIAIGVSWKIAAPDSVEAELWSANAVQAAPRAATPAPAPTPVPPTPVPETPPPPPPAPTPVVQQPRVAPAPPAPVIDPQIAIEKEKQRQADVKREEQEEREAERKALVERRKQDQARQQVIDTAKAQARADAQAKSQAQADAQAAAEKREAAEKQAKADAARKQADTRAAAALEAQRKENLNRMLAQAGGSGDARSTGTAAQSSGPSAGYAGRLRARVRPNIIFPDDTQGNPTAEVEVRAGPDGSILSRRLSRSSGNQAWDDAVIRAIDRTGTLPQDVDGRVPPSLVITFRARDF